MMYNLILKGQGQLLTSGQGKLRSLGDPSRSKYTSFDAPCRDERNETNHTSPEYETDSFKIIQSSPSPLASDPDPVQSGLVDQKPIQSNPICLGRTVQIFVHCVKCIHTYTYSFVNLLHKYVGRLCYQKFSKTLYVL